MYLSLDIETTSLKADAGMILSFGCLFDNLTDVIPLAEVPVFEYLFLSDSLYGDVKAIEMNLELIKRINLETEKLKRYERENVIKSGNLTSILDKPNNFLRHFTMWLMEDCNFDMVKRYTLAGKNVAMFDLPWLNHHLNFSANIPHHHRILDVGSMYYEGGECPPSLSEINEKLGHAPVKHDAVQDAIDVARAIRIALGVDI